MAEFCLYDNEPIGSIKGGFLELPEQDIITSRVGKADLGKDKSNRPQT